MSTETMDRWLSQLRANFAKRGVRPTPQALSALAESLKRSDWEILGDTDSLLVGLLYSGSYTVDVLESAGVNALRLRELAEKNVDDFRRHSWRDEEEDDPIGTLFAESSGLYPLMQRVIEGGGHLETAHILEASLVPQLTDDLSRVPFPIDQRSDGPNTSPLLRGLEASVCELIAYATTTLDTTGSWLRDRRERLTSAERRQVVAQLAAYHELPDRTSFNFVTRAMDQWFARRTIMVEPADQCLRAIADLASLTYGPQFLSDVGGNLSTIDSVLRMATKLSPERDFTELVLFERDGRISVGQYTYRNSFETHRDKHDGHAQPLSLHAIRPVSLVSAAALSELEQIVADDSGTEWRLQAFFNRHTEFLEALGYSRAIPHLRLREDVNDKKLVPDYILQLPGALGFDILDLKLPTTRVFAREPYLRVSGEISKAIAQLRKYRAFFEIPKNRIAFERKYGLEAFRPELVVVIGRSSQFRSHSERLEVEEQMRGVRLLTYDDLIAYGRSRSLVLP